MAQCLLLDLWGIQETNWPKSADILSGGRRGAVLENMHSQTHPPKKDGTVYDDLESQGFTGAVVARDTVCGFPCLCLCRNNEQSLVPGIGHDSVAALGVQSRRGRSSALTQHLLCTFPRLQVPPSSQFP